MKHIEEKDLVWSTPTDPLVGSRWEHVESRRIYVVAGVALNALQARVRLIHYYAEGDLNRRLWVRPLDMFLQRFQQLTKVPERPSFEEIYLDLAKRISARSLCERLSVGCVIASEDHSEVFAVGYNGGPKGSKRKCRGKDFVSSCGCMHAESNAIAKCRGGRSERKIVYVTHSPCELCATALVNMGGVVAVHWLETYRSSEGGEILREAGIETTSAQ